MSRILEREGAAPLDRGAGIRSNECPCATRGALPNSATKALIYSNFADESGARMGSESFISGCTHA